MPVADRHVEHCEGLAARAARGRAASFVDDSKETVGKKIRASQLMKAPYTLVVGDRDIEAGTYTVRDRDGDETPGLAFDDIVAALVDEVRTRALDPDATSEADRMADHLWSPWRMQYIQEAKEEPDDAGCVFCAIPQRPSPSASSRAASSPTSSLNKYPYNPGHLLVVPLRHVGDLEAVDRRGERRLQPLLQRAVERAPARPSEPARVQHRAEPRADGGRGHPRSTCTGTWCPRWSGDTNFMPVVGETRVLPGAARRDRTAGSSRVRRDERRCARARSTFRADPSTTRSPAKARSSR